MDDVRLELLDDAREPPGRREIDFISRRQRNEVGALGHPAIQLALWMRHPRRAVPPGPQPHHRVHHLALTATPGACSVYVEREHARLPIENSQSPTPNSQRVIWMLGVRGGSPGS